MSAPPLTPVRLGFAVGVSAFVLCVTSVLLFVVLEAARSVHTAVVADVVKALFATSVLCTGVASAAFVFRSILECEETANKPNRH
jgi:hypothetical protein